QLPFQARELTKHDLRCYEPMFAMYLDIQKGLSIEDLPSDEVRGRWKSFVGKWNRGILAEGWYDPATLRKARRAAEEVEEDGNHPRDRDGARQYSAAAANAPRNEEEPDEEEEEDDDDDDDEYGPNLPSTHPRPGPSSGPTIPTTQDLQLRKESAIEDSMSTRKTTQKEHRADVHAHRSARRDLEDEVAPRAEPGTHERRLEKRRDNAAANRSFAETRRGGSPIDAAPEEELMGSGENDLQAIKRTQEKEERKKNEREIKREEILRARAAEREERVQRFRQKEDETIGWLKALAKQRFG
ncbi:hypothetical protein PHISP_04609, partial [Aspergillus sp. HF37]